MSALEKLNQAYTGADYAFYERSKETMKMAAHTAGVKTPAFVFAYNDEHIRDAAHSLSYPLFVKVLINNNNNSYSYSYCSSSYSYSYFFNLFNIF